MNLNQVTLFCIDLEASVHFYTRLGFRQIVSSPPRYARFECESGTTFSLHTVPDRTGEPGIVVYFEVENLDSAVARLQDSGIIFESMPRDQSWLWRESHLKDPSGNMLCLYQAGSNRRYPPWRLK